VFHKPGVFLNSRGVIPILVSTGNPDIDTASLFRTSYKIRL